MIADVKSAVIARIPWWPRRQLAQSFMVFSTPPQLTLSTVMPRIKGRSSRRIQMEAPDLRKRYWGSWFWARGYFSITSGNVTDGIKLQYLELHSKCHPTGVSR